MKNYSVIASLLFWMGTSVLAAGTDPTCSKTSLIHFYSQGKEVESQVIGQDDPDTCDKFGGNLVYTPKNHLYLYVNFNIPGSIDLDGMDSAYDAAPADANTRSWLQVLSVAIVDKDWIKNTYHVDQEAVLNWAQTDFFISEKVLEEGRFAQLMTDFYKHPL